MASGYIQLWGGYLDDSEGYIDFSTPMPHETPAQFEDSAPRHKQKVEEAELPRVYFHLDPESLDENVGVRWKDSAGKGAAPSEAAGGEGGVGGGQLFGYSAEDPKLARMRGFKLRFDDYIKLDAHQSTEESIRLLRKMALPWTDIRAMIHVTRTQVIYKTLHKSILIKEVARQAPLPFKIAAAATRVTYIDPVILKNIERPTTVVNGPVEIESKGRVISPVKLPPRPVEMVLPGLSDMLCVIEKFDYEITRLDSKGVSRAATVTLDLVQYPGGTLENVVSIGDIYPNALSAERREEVKYVLMTLVSRDDGGKIIGRKSSRPITAKEFASLGE